MLAWRCPVRCTANLAVGLLLYDSKEMVKMGRGRVAGGVVLHEAACGRGSSGRVGVRRAAIFFSLDVLAGWAGFWHLWHLRVAPGTWHL